MRLKGLRWLMIGLIFLATVINYIDRQTVSVLKTSISQDLGLSNADYAAVQNSFLLFYGISQLVSGRLYDIIGTRLGFAFSITIWSLAALAHAAARTASSFALFRGVLGFGEAGNWPGAAKVVGEWLPTRERALGMGIFNTGAAVGGALSPPLIAWLATVYGWQMTFIVTGALGFVWLALWLVCFQTPERHRWITNAERAHIEDPQSRPDATRAKRVEGWLHLLAYRQTWAIVMGRFITDPIWWLYIFWLPSYLQEARGLSLQQVGQSAWVPFLAAGAGALSGGYASGALIARGWTVDRARKTVMIAGALLTPAGILAMRASDPYVSLAWMAVVLFGFQVWINNLQTLPSDFFPNTAVGSVFGLGGAAAALASILFTWGTGRVVDAFGYTPMFVVAAVMGPLGLIVTLALAGRIQMLKIGAVLVFGLLIARPGAAQEAVPSIDELLAHKVALKPELAGVHPRVFVTKAGLEHLRERARTTHRAEWSKVTAGLVALKGAPPPVPGPQERRSQNDVAFAIAEASLAYAVDRKPAYLAAAKAWTLAAIDYEPWGYTYNKPNTDLAAGHLLYAIGWAYDLLYDDFTAAERASIRRSLERHAGLVYDALAPRPGRTLNYTQNHDFVPTSGLAVTALALMGESKDAERWAVMARAHHVRAGQLLSPDGHYYEGMEYWIFSAPWLVHFLDAWEHSTGESLWDRDVYRNWKTYLAHALLPDGQNVFDFGDIWEGALTRAKTGAEYTRVYPGGTLQSNFNVMYRVAARLKDSQAQAVAERYASFGHSNLEEFWTLLWRDPSLRAAPIAALPLAHHFKDSGVVYMRSSWRKDATAIAFKAGPPEGHRTAALLPRIPDWRLDSGHAHPDAGSFIVWAHGRYLTGDTGYAGLPSARNHNTLTFGEKGQGNETQHDVWRSMDYRALDGIRIREAEIGAGGGRIVADLAAAYPKAAGVSSFTRTFAWDGKSIITVSDAVALESPKTAEWHLQSDSPFEGSGVRFRNGKTGEPSLRVSFAAPQGLTVTTGVATVRAPGPPGSIETGVEEPRGYMLRGVAPPSATFRFEATLEVLR